MAKRGGDTRAKAAEHGKKVGRPKGKALPPKPGKAELVEIFAAAHRPAKANENPLITKWRQVFETKNDGLLFDALKYQCDQSYGKATQPVDHGAGGPIQVAITTNVKMPDPHE